jgi:hypothetical protein
MQMNEIIFFNLFNFNIEIVGHCLKHVGAIIGSCKHATTLFTIIYYTFKLFWEFSFLFAWYTHMINFENE